MKNYLIIVLAEGACMKASTNSLDVESAYRLIRAKKTWNRRKWNRKSGTELVPILSRFGSNFASNLLEIRALALFRGKTGIRTLEPFLTTTRFPDVPLQPLEHLSRLQHPEKQLRKRLQIYE